MGSGRLRGSDADLVVLAEVNYRRLVAPDPPGRPPLSVVVLLVLAAVGACMIAASMMVTDMLGMFGGWPAVAVGFVLLMGSVWGLWVIQKARDRTLR